MKPVLVRDLAVEQWASMQRYADAMVSRMPQALVPDEWRMQGQRYLTRFWSYPRALRRYRGDLVHVLDHSYAHCVASFPRMPSIVTVHDLHPLRVLAESRRTPRGLVRNVLLRRGLRWLARADRLIVISQFTAREVERYLDIPAERIRVVPLGVDAHFFQRPDEESVVERRREWHHALRREGNSTQLILHVGHCQQRKNVEAAIAALGLLRERGIDAALIQIGGTFGPSHLDAIRTAGVADHVIQEPQVREDSLVAAYYAADALVIPSTLEGYGLPVVEAMAAGLPVVTSGAGGLREAAGDAGIVTGSVDAPPLADALGELLTNHAMREERIGLGRAHAATVTWDRTVERTLAVYAELVAT